MLPVQGWTPPSDYCPSHHGLDRDGALPTRFGRISGSGHAGPPFAAYGLIGTASAVASIETRSPSHRVVAALPEQPIPACSSLQDIVSRTSEQLVVAAIAVQLIATRTTANDSSPPRPKIVSFPARPWMTSLPGVPKIVLLLLSPTMVAGSPLHRTGGWPGGWAGGWPGGWPGGGTVMRGEMGTLVSTFKLPPQLKGLPNYSRLLGLPPEH